MEWGSVTAGVPQVSIFGPLFFLVYINDLTDNLKCNVKLFADDTSLFMERNTEHFLLLCHLYNGPRSNLLKVNAKLLTHGCSSLSNEVLLEFILYGDERVVIDTSKKLHEAALKFIHASESF